MDHRATIFCLVLLSAPAVAGGPPPTAAAPATQLRNEGLERGNFKAQVRNNLRNGNFDWLEKTGEMLLKEDPRYSSGISKLVDFYIALDYEGLAEEGDARVATFTAWQKAKPDSHWPKVGFSLVEATRAGVARGGKVANQVTPEQWAEHNRHVKLAWEWGQKAIADDAKDPNIFAHMIGVCRRASCPREELDRLLAAALAINPNFDGVYVEMAYALVPKWLGSPDEFVAFAEQSADANRALGNLVYARIAVMGLGSEKDKIREVFPRLSWDRILDGLRQTDKRYPDSDRTFHVMARFAYLYGDRPVAREALSRLKNGWRADVQYWGTPDAFLKAYAWAMDDQPGPF